MRIRTVKPEMWEDEKIACLSRDARLMFIGCFNIADDEGLLRWTPAYIKSNLFMYDDDLGITEIQSLMGEVVDQGLVLEYSPAAAKGSVKQKLAWIIKFRVHQKINRPQASKLTPPSLGNTAVQAAYAQRDNYVCHLCNGPVNEHPHRVGDPYSVSEPPNVSSLNASLDHIKPRTKGGGDHPTNIALAHVGCNKGRRERSISDFRVPLSVRSALVLVGWVSDHDVNDSLNCSVNDSLLEEDREGEQEKEREQGKDEEREEEPLPPEPPAEEWVAPTDVIVDAPEFVGTASKPQKQRATNASKAVVRQVLGYDYPNTTVEALGFQVEKLIAEGHPDNMIRETLMEFGRRPKAIPAWLPSIYGDVVQSHRAGANVTAFDRKKAHNAAIFQALGDQPSNPELLA